MSAALTLVARVLILAIPALLVFGKAPPDIAVSLVALLFLVRSAMLRDFSWAGTPWLTAALAVLIYLMCVSLAAEHTGAALGRAGPWVRFVLFAAALYWFLRGWAVAAIGERPGAPAPSPDAGEAAGAAGKPA